MTDIVERLDCRDLSKPSPVRDLYLHGQDPDAYPLSSEAIEALLALTNEAASTIAPLREDVERLNRAVNQYAYERDKAREERDQAERRSEQFWRGQLTALRQRVVEVVGPFANMLPDNIVAKDALQEQLQQWCRAARALLTELKETPTNGK